MKWYRDAMEKKNNGTGSGSAAIEDFCTWNERNGETYQFWGPRGPLLTWIHAKDVENKEILISDHGDLPDDKIVESHKSSFRAKSPTSKFHDKLDGRIEKLDSSWDKMFSRPMEQSTDDIVKTKLENINNLNAMKPLFNSDNGQYEERYKKNFFI